jgi:hypothetical protein
VALSILIVKVMARTKHSVREGGKGKGKGGGLIGGKLARRDPNWQKLVVLSVAFSLGVCALPGQSDRE